MFGNRHCRSPLVMATAASRFLFESSKINHDGIRIMRARNLTTALLGATAVVALLACAPALAQNKQGGGAPAGGGAPHGGGGGGGGAPHFGGGGGGGGSPHFGGGGGGGGGAPHIAAPQIS